MTRARHDYRVPSWYTGPSGGTTSSSPTSALFNVTNGQGSTMVAGTPIIVDSGGAKKGQASSQARSLLQGVLVADVAATLVGEALAGGPLELTTAQWDAVTGGSGGLTVGASYYLSATLGQLTATPPTTLGHSVVFVGRAISATVLDIEIERPVLL